MKVTRIHSSKTTVLLLIFGGLCGYGAYHIFSNNPTDEGVVWAFALFILSGLSLLSGFRGRS